MCKHIIANTEVCFVMEHKLSVLTVHALPFVTETQIIRKYRARIYTVQSQ
jgi:hypothetical protein